VGIKGRKGVSAATRGEGAPVLAKLAVSRVVWVSPLVLPVGAVAPGIGADDAKSYTYPASQGLGEEVRGVRTRLETRRRVGVEKEEEEERVAGMDTAAASPPPTLPLAAGQVKVYVKGVGENPEGAKLVRT
jgi:hypothetical protein